MVAPTLRTLHVGLYSDEYQAVTLYRCLWGRGDMLVYPALEELALSTRRHFNPEHSIPSIIEDSFPRINRLSLSVPYGALEPRYDIAPEESFWPLQLAYACRHLTHLRLNMPDDRTTGELLECLIARHAVELRDPLGPPNPGIALDWIAILRSNQLLDFMSLQRLIVDLPDHSGRCSNLGERFNNALRGISSRRSDVVVLHTKRGSRSKMPLDRFRKVWEASLRDDPALWNPANKLFDIMDTSERWVPMQVRLPVGGLWEAYGKLEMTLPRPPEPTILQDPEAIDEDDGGEVPLSHDGDTGGILDDAEW
jgi:hypothetical protein